MQIKKLSSHTIKLLQGQESIYIKNSCGATRLDALHPLIAYCHMLLFLTKLHSPSHLLACSRTISHVILSAIRFQFALRSPFTSCPSAAFHQLRLSVKLSLKLLALPHRFKKTLSRYSGNVNYFFTNICYALFPRNT